MTTIVIIAAVWLACSVAVYLLLRHYHREMFGEWRRNDRWECFFFALYGPMSLLVAIAFHALENSKRGNDILWRKDKP